MRSRILGLAALVLGLGFLSGSVRAADPQVVAWMNRMEKIEELLHDGDWSRSLRTSDRLLEEYFQQLAVRGSDLIGKALVLRAIAFEGSGQREEALWDAFAADAFSHWTRQLLARHGEPGEPLLEALRESSDTLDANLDVVVETGEGLIVLASGAGDASASLRSPETDGEPGTSISTEVSPPRKRTSANPHFPVAIRRAVADHWAERWNDVIVQVIIDEQGRPTSPRIVRGGAHPVLLLSALEAMRQWRFDPATRDGEPVKAHYNLTIHYKL